MMCAGGAPPPKGQPMKNLTYDLTYPGATVEQVAGMALYLASDQAASVTGAILSMDGGWTAQ